MRNFEEQRTLLSESADRAINYTNFRIKAN